MLTFILNYNILIKNPRDRCRIAENCQFITTAFLFFLMFCILRLKRSPYFVGSALQVDFPAFVGEGTLKPQEEVTATFNDVLRRLEGKALAQFLMVTRMAVFIHTLSHHVHLAEAKPAKKARSKIVRFISSRGSSDPNENEYVFNYKQLIIYFLYVLYVYLIWTNKNVVFSNLAPHRRIPLRILYVQILFYNNDYRDIKLSFK